LAVYRKVAAMPFFVLCGTARVDAGGVDVGAWIGSAEAFATAADAAGPLGVMGSSNPGMVCQIVEAASLEAAIEQVTGFSWDRDERP